MSQQMLWESVVDHAIDNWKLIVAAIIFITTKLKILCIIGKGVISCLLIQIIQKLKLCVPVFKARIFLVKWFAFTSTVLFGTSVIEPSLSKRTIMFYVASICFCLLKGFFNPTRCPFFTTTSIMMTSGRLLRKFYLIQHILEPYYDLRGLRYRDILRPHRTETNRFLQTFLCNNYCVSVLQ